MQQPADDPARLVGRVTAVLAIAAGVIHLSAAGDHIGLPVMLAGFLVVGTLQVALGGLLMTRRPSRWVVLSGIALTLGSVGLWLLSRTEGLPFVEDGHLEPIGVKDGVTVLFELGSLPGLLLLLSRDLSQVALPARLGTQTLSAVAAVTFALMVPALVLKGGTVHSHEQAVELGIHDEDGHEVADAHPRGEGHVRGARAHRHTRGGHPRGHDRKRSGGGHGHTQLASTGSGHTQAHGGGDGGHRPRGHAPRDHGGRPHNRGDGHPRDEAHRDHPPQRPGGGDGHDGHYPEPRPPESEQPPPEAEPAICLRVTQTDICVPGGR